MSEEDLLNNADLSVDEERENAPEDGEVLQHGEVTVVLDFAEGVEYDVDDGGEGTLYIQYWDERDVDEANGGEKA